MRVRVAGGRLPSSANSWRWLIDLLLFTFDCNFTEAIGSHSVIWSAPKFFPWLAVHVRPLVKGYELGFL